MNQTLTLYPSVSIGRTFSIKFVIRLLWIASFTALAALLFLYIFQVNDLTKKIYTSQVYGKKLEKLSLENKNSEINFSTANSLLAIEGQIKNLNLEQVGEIKYIKVLDNQMAKTTKEITRP